MKPIEAGFDGAEGINMGIPHLMKGGGIYRLIRGKTNPMDAKRSFSNMLIWHYPDGQDPKLLFCNTGGEWFDLTFDPINLKDL